MGIFNNDAGLERENDELRRRIMEFESKKEEENEELKWLREAIKPYVDYHKRPNFLFGGYHFVTCRTLQQAEKEISELKLYVAVLEGELGKEWAESAKATFKALKELKQ